MPNEMDSELNFPNPVLRNDLPVKRKRWPRVVAALLALGLLFIAGLPQFLHTRVGLKFTRLYLATKFSGSDIYLQDFHTSWFGGTIATGLVIQTADGRLIECRSIQSDISLGRLLRGSFHLGHTRIDGLYIDDVLDYGDGTDSLSRLFPGLLPNPNGAAFASIPAPKLSGNIQLTNATLNLYRGHIDSDTLGTIFQAFRVARIDGTLNIPSFDGPCSCDLTGDIGGEESQSGTVHCDGDFALSRDGVITPRSIRMHRLLVEGKNWPTETVAPVLVPKWAASDYVESLGPVVGEVSIPFSAEEGELRIDPLSLVSSRSNILVPLIYDMNSIPRRWSLGAGPNNLVIGLAKDFAKKSLVPIVPFLGESTGEGKLQFHLDAFSVPLGKAFSQQVAVRGQMQLKDVKLDPSRDMLPHDGPKSLTRQMLDLTGNADGAARPSVNTPAVNFEVRDGQVKVEPSPITVGNMPASLSGTSIIDGPVMMKLTFADLPKLRSAVPGLSVAMLVIPLGGTVRDPHLDLESYKNALPAPMAKALDDFIDAQIAALRANEAKRIDDQLQADVKERLAPLQPALSTTQP